MLGELSTDVRAAIVLDEDSLAAASGDSGRGEELRATALELLESAAGVVAGATQVEAAVQGGTVFAVRGARFAICVVAGPRALSSLMLFDLRHLLGDLGDPA